MKCVIMRNPRNIKTIVLQDFHIYISVRSKNEILKKSFILNMDSEEERAAAVVMKKTEKSSIWVKPWLTLRDVLGFYNTLQLKTLYNIP